MSGKNNYQKVRIRLAERGHNEQSGIIARLTQGQHRVYNMNQCLDVFLIGTGLTITWLYDANNPSDLLPCIQSHLEESQQKEVLPRLQRRFKKFDADSLF
ncbi:MAG: hypothetical protein GKR94_18615 [Gammaproteobacteria bacterium]|nr:hypothetical protein [Gammaproteobacteria bacterium]